jgi:hypothetical protein
MDSGNVRISGIFSGLIAILALAVSLASAGWSVFAYWKSSEVSPLAFEEVTFISESGVAKVAVEVTVANLAYGEYDDVARTQYLDLHNGERRLRFVARAAASLRQRGVAADGTLEVLEYPCHEAGAGIAACIISESPVVSLPAGGVTTTYPVFELAGSDCGLDNCDVLLVGQLAEFLTENTTVTYTVVTMRDGERSWGCALDITRAGIDYLPTTGWYNPACKEAAQ